MNSSAYTRAIQYGLLAASARNDYAKLTYEHTAQYWWNTYCATSDKYWTVDRLVASGKKAK